MPKPWQPTGGSGAVTVLNASVLLNQRPQCAQLLGAIVVAWSNAEATLAWYYSTLVLGPTLQGVPQGQAHWITMHTFDMLFNFPQRLNMLVKAAELRNFDKDTIKEFRKRLHALQEAGSDRIIAAHGRWGIDDTLPNALVWTKTLAGVRDAMVYESNDFIQSLRAIEKASGELQSFFSVTLLPRLKQEAESLIAAIKTTQNIQSAVEGDLSL